MTRTKELIFLFSVMFLQVKSFLPFGGAKYAVFSGDNVILVIGMIMVLTSGIFNKVKLSPTTKYAFYSGIVFLLVLPAYLYIKNFVVFGAPPEGLGTFYKTVLRLVFVFYFLKYLNISDVQYKRGLNAILIFGVIVTLSMLFEDLFRSLGFAVDKYGVGLERAEMYDESGRYAGITGLNVNDLGALLAVFLGILFYMFKNKLIKPYPFIFYLSFIASGIMLTGSRTAFIITNILILFFVLEYSKRLNFKSFILLLIFFAAVFYVYEYFGIATVKRLEQHSDSEYFGLGLRMSYWAMYLNDIGNNPIYLLTGNLAPATYHRSAHNFYIQLVFQSGLIFLIVAFYFLFKSISSKSFIKNKSSLLSLDYKYILVPQFIIWMTSASYLGWFVLIALGASGIIFDLDIKNYSKKTNVNREELDYNPSLSYSKSKINPNPN